MWKKIANKKLIIVLLFGYLLFSIGGYYLIKYQEDKLYQANTNNAVYSLIDLIKKQYPNVSEQEILKVLNTTDFEKINLEKYGIEDEELIYNNEILKEKYNLYYGIYFSVNSLIIVLFLIIYHYFEKKKVKEISSYIDDILSFKENLKISENNESSLSNLQNQLYKITILLREQKELEHQEKENLKDLLQNISHQFKTPLTSMTIMIDNILNTKMPEQQKKEFLKEISNQIEHLNFLTHSLLKISCFDAGVITLKKEEVNIRKLLEEALKKVEILIELKNINIQVEAKEDLVLLIDHNWQLEALTNILKNAIEYSKENGQIILQASQNSFYTEIIIKDFGKGIPKNDLKNIFKKFYKGKNSSSNSVGIGLSLAHTIITKQNGYISVDSKENEGTTFKIKFKNK